MTRIHKAPKMGDSGYRDYILTRMCMLKRETFRIWSPRNFLHYCVLYNVDHQHRTVDCPRRQDETIEVSKGKGFMSRKVTYYRCRGRREQDKQPIFNS